MVGPDKKPLGQNVNAARVHRLLACLYALFALLALVGTIIGAFQTLLLGASGHFFLSLLVVAFWVVLAGVNYGVAAGALAKEKWALMASVVMAVLLLIIGLLLFWNRPDMQALVDRGDAGAAFAASIVVALTVAHLIASIYILLNSNWRRPVPPEEGPDSNIRP